MNRTICGGPDPDCEECGGTGVDFAESWINLETGEYVEQPCLCLEEFVNTMGGW